MSKTLLAEFLQPLRRDGLSLVVWAQPLGVRRQHTGKVHAGFRLFDEVVEDFRGFVGFRLDRGAQEYRP